MTLTERIDRLLPQTQCGRCGYAGCRPYAEALAQGEADLNRCPPGGEAGIAALSQLLGRTRLPLDPQCGSQADPGVALIDPERCVGCARCLPACPVDAILGAQRQLHTVIEHDCNGCELCLAACPVDCIDMVPRTADEHAPSSAENRLRYQRHRARVATRAQERAQLLEARQQAALASASQ